MCKIIVASWIAADQEGDPRKRRGGGFLEFYAHRLLQAGKYLKNEMLAKPASREIVQKKYDHFTNLRTIRSRIALEKRDEKKK